MSSTITKRQLEIIEAAGKIMTDKGVSGLTTKKLASEMNFSESALYRHFKSKEEIIISMLKFLASNMSLLAVDQDEQSATSQLRQFFSKQFEFFNQKPHFVIAVFAEGLLEESEGINQAIQQVMASRIQVLSPIILKGQETEEFTKALKVEDLIHVIMGSMRLFIFKWRMSRFEFDIIKEGEQKMNSIIQLIQNK